MKKMLVGHCLGMSSMVRTRAPLHLEVVKKCTIVDSIDSIDSRISVTKSIFAFPLASKSSGTSTVREGLWEKNQTIIRRLEGF